MQEDKPLTSRFENFGAAPTEVLWDKIEAHLAPKRKKRALFLWFFTGIVFAGLSFSCYFFNSSKDTSDGLLAVKTIQEPTVSKIENTPKTNAKTFTKIEKSELSKFNSNGFSNTTQQASSRGKVIKTKTVDLKQVQPTKTYAISPLELKTLVGFRNEVLAEKSQTELELLFSENTFVLDSTLMNSEKLDTEINEPELDNTVNKRKAWEISFTLGSGRGRKQNIIVPTYPTWVNNDVQSAFGINQEALSDVEFIYPSQPIILQALIGREIAKFLRLSGGIGYTLNRTYMYSLSMNDIIRADQFQQFNVGAYADLKIINRPKIEWSTGPGIKYHMHHSKLNQENYFAFTFHWQTTLRYHLSDQWSVFFQPGFQLKTYKNVAPEKNTPNYNGAIWNLNLGAVYRF